MARPRAGAARRREKNPVALGAIIWVKHAHALGLTSSGGSTMTTSSSSDSGATRAFSLPLPFPPAVVVVVDDSGLGCGLGLVLGATRGEEDEAATVVWCLKAALREGWVDLPLAFPGAPDLAEAEEEDEARGVTIDFLSSEARRGCLRGLGGAWGEDPNGQTSRRARKTRGTTCVALESLPWRERSRFAFR